MPTFTYETTIDAPLDVVWAFHDDVAKSLPAISPPKDRVTIESMDAPPLGVGFKLRIVATSPFGRRVRWVARFVEYEPPHDVLFGRQARFVDVQDAGPFKSWRHSHEFETIDAKTTRLVDRIDYVVGKGPLGWLADVFVVRPKLRSMFAHREKRLRELLR
jgi:ligand-binding SRPBCC domain-containing protein